MSAPNDAKTEIAQAPAEGSSSEISVRKFQNGWTAELEDLIADWADKAACYRWMHEYSSKLYKGYNSSFMIPIIVLSTLSGVANFGLNSVLGNDENAQKWAQFSVGGVSIFAAILTTLANFYGFAEEGEGHRVAAMSWSKFNRLLCIEMRLPPDERTDALQFLKMFRIELDRLVEMSPIIPDKVIHIFNAMFEKNVEITKPEITGIIERTPVFKDSGERLKKIAAEAAIVIHQRKGLMRQLIMDDLNNKLEKIARDTAIKLWKEEQLKKTIGNRIDNDSPALNKLRQNLDVMSASVYTDGWATSVDQPNVVVITPVEKV